MKPPYVVPAMAEIAEIPDNGYRVASLFAGGGGSSTGYRMAGFRVLYANEFVDAAAETYLLNARPGTVVDRTDIRELKPEQVLEACQLEVGQLDVLDGSPPCSSFSTAGKRSAKWGQVSKYSDTAQRTDDLFYEFARIVDGVRPKVFVAENVSGLVKGSAKGYFKAILARLRECGYRVEARLLDAQWLGVPQMRQRLIFVGVREDLPATPAHPSPLSYRYSIREVLPGLAGMELAAWGLGSYEDRKNGGPVPTQASDLPCPTITTSGPAASGDYALRVVHDTSGQFSRGDITDMPATTITVGVNLVNSHHFQVYDATSAVDPETGQDLSIKNFAIGKEWDKLRRGQSSPKFFQLTRSDHEKPMGTLTVPWGAVSGASVAHGFEPRKFNLVELRALCSFPADFQLTGTYQQRWERCARAVPPLMMRAIATTIRDEVLPSCAG